MLTAPVSISPCRQLALCAEELCEAVLQQRAVLGSLCGCSAHFVQRPLEVQGLRVKDFAPLPDTLSVCGFLPTGAGDAPFHLTGCSPSSRLLQ